MMLSLYANKVWAKIQFWTEISREPSQLKRLSDYFLRNIGLIVQPLFVKLGGTFGIAAQLKKSCSKDTMI